MGSNFTKFGACKMEILQTNYVKELFYNRKEL